MVLGRVIRALPGGEACSVIRTRWLTTIFVIGDVFSFLVQASGAGLMVKDGSMKTGENIVVAGLVIQIIWFGLFGVTAIIFHLRYRSKSAVTASYGGHSGPTAAELPWQRLLMMLYIVSVFIMIRSIFRVIEYVMGSDGYLLQHEWTLYVFDSILMFGVMAVYFVWYPSGLQPQVISTPASMEMAVPREEDERNKQHYGRH
ncbi:putative rta1 domain protein [Phaeoacremonium minimum UCRPA7]|uniref:Putative rta1 domain protein n=1 Tax=Phaeoacremonium minimum (strain UCR-PA7) TaxID=1286976 RepID=R8BWE7_PHAM7|nr:putative rta1 domain protein [Phaeoacremonium minimum UCRPA7]EOO03701.1 putative rta1 domain protein [Phaeoacremonium minimum UCRPA7]